jgi:MerR family transcriptional regulator, copper efflux regulator
MGLRIGNLAKRSGVNKETIRYYETLGLIPEPPRGVSGFREYPPEVVERVRFIKHAQTHGFTLKEIEEILLADKETGAWNLKQLAARKLKQIEQRLEELGRIKTLLTTLMCQCSGEGSVSECPIMISISTHEKNSRGL